MRSWYCVECGKQEETRWFCPKWMVTHIGDYYTQRKWKPNVKDAMNPWDYGSTIECGRVLLAKKRHF